MLRFILVVWLALLAAACGGGDAQDPATVGVGGTSGCGLPLAAPGEYELHNVVGDVDQPYWLVVPEAYVDTAPVPLYLHLAPGGGSHNPLMEGWRPYLDDLDGLMAMVNTATVGSKDPQTLVALVDQVSADYCVDPKRVHALGTSWSSYAADELACEASDRIASFVSALGGSGVSRELCNPGRPVPLLTFTGDTDRVPITALATKWAERNGCDSEPMVEDLGSGVFRKTYQNCAADVVFYDIEGMGHVWPMHEVKGPSTAYVREYEEVDYLEEALQFFGEHPLP